MSNFLSWATDVLEKVDQSAASLSDSSQERSKRYVTEDGTSAQIIAIKYPQEEYLRDTSTNGSSWASSSQDHPFSIMDNSGALHAARVSSDAMDSLRAARKALDGHEWVKEENRLQFDEILKQTSEDEAKLAVLVRENEKLKKSSTMALSLKRQEINNLQEEIHSVVSAISDEKSAHATSKEEFTARKESLSEENVALRKALSSIRKQTEEKLAEASKFQLMIDDLKVEKEQTMKELEDIEAIYLRFTNDRHHQDSLAPSAHIKSSPEKKLSQQLTQDASASELLVKKQELASLDAQMAQLESEIEEAHRSSSKWPIREGFREKELERRLRNLNEQLLAKEAQAESLANEKASLQVRLDNALDTLRVVRGESNSSQADRKRNKIGRNKHNKSGVPPEDDPSGKLRPRTSPSVLSETVGMVAQTMDSLSMSAGVALQRHSFVRSFIVAYVLGLHLAVFVILSLAAAQRALGGK